MISIGKLTPVKPRLAAMVLLGGVIGFIKAKSKASLIAAGHDGHGAGDGEGWRDG